MRRKVWELWCNEKQRGAKEQRRPVTRSLGEEAVRTAANSIGIVWKNNELRGKNIESTRVVTEELRQDVRRKSLEKQSFVLEMLRIVRSS